ncbi:MAG: type II toxin-antitoxin system VapB family antitoxin [Candidatus Marinimicrobia bacterium]|nr:type II toxin-antitoxin system VapB family antitoxin [Candidatus Neomarinimicrobiota bacterium]
MRTTINIEEDLVAEASRLTGVKEKTSLVRMGLKALIAYESGRRLAKLGGSEPQLDDISRRRFETH